MKENYKEIVIICSMYLIDFDSNNVMLLRSDGCSAEFGWECCRVDVDCERNTVLELVLDVSKVFFGE